MEIGSAIAVSSAIIGTVAVIFRIFPKNGNGKKVKMADFCSDHSRVCEKLEGLDAWLNKIEQKLDRVIEGRGTH